MTGTVQISPAAKKDAASMRICCVKHLWDAASSARKRNAVPCACCPGHAPPGCDVATLTGKGGETMQAMIDFICGDAAEFTPQVVAGLIVFSLTLECLGDIARSIMSAGRR